MSKLQDIAERRASMGTESTEWWRIEDIPYLFDLAAAQAEALRVIAYGPVGFNGHCYDYTSWAAQGQAAKQIAIEALGETPGGAA